MEDFYNATLSAEDAFWVMWYFLEEHYQLSQGTFDVSDILSASEPAEYDVNGHLFGKAPGPKRVAVADPAMISFWNEAIEKFQKNGMPPPKQLS